MITPTATASVGNAVADETEALRSTLEDLRTLLGLDEEAGDADEPDREVVAEVLEKGANASINVSDAPPGQAPSIDRSWRAPGQDGPGAASPDLAALDAVGDLPGPSPRAQGAPSEALDASIEPEVDVSRAASTDLPLETPLDEGAASEGDGVPERWVVGSHVVEGAERTLDERVRVLQGSELVLANTTLAFGAHSDGPTGLVAEPGSKLVLRNTTIRAAPDVGQQHPLVVHLEGRTVVDGATVTDATHVVVQPRSASDHAERALVAPLDGAPPAADAMRAYTNATASLRDLTTRAAGPGLVLGVPTARQTYAPRPAPSVTTSGLDVAASQGPALACYETHRPHENPHEIPVSGTGQGLPNQLTLQDATLSTTDGPAVVCPPEPTAFTMPGRTTPVGTFTAESTPTAPSDALLSLAELVPQPPAPTAEEGPGTLVLDGGTFTADGPGVHVGWDQEVDVRRTSFHGTDPAVQLADPGATAELVEPTGKDLDRGLVAVDGSLSMHGGHLAGVPGSTGLVLDGADAHVDRASLTGFTTAVRASDAEFEMGKVDLAAGEGSSAVMEATASDVGVFETTASGFDEGLVFAGGQLELQAVQLDGTGHAGSTGLALAAATSTVADSTVTGYADGLAVDDGRVTVDATRFEGTGTGLAARSLDAALTLDDVRFDRFPVGIATVGGSLDASAITLAGTGVHGPALALSGTGATVQTVDARAFGQAIDARDAALDLDQATFEGTGSGTAVTTQASDLHAASSSFTRHTDGVHADGGSVELVATDLEGTGPGSGAALAAADATVTLEDGSLTGFDDGVALARSTLTGTASQLQGTGAGGSTAATLDAGQLTLDASTVAGFEQGFQARDATASLTGTPLTGTGTPGSQLAQLEGTALSITDASVQRFADGARLAGGSLTLDTVQFAGTGAGLAASLDAAASGTITDSAIREVDAGVVTRGSVDVTRTDLVADELCLEAEQAAVEVRDSSFSTCAFGIVLDRSSGSTLQDNTFTDVADPLEVESPDVVRDHYDHTVTGNTVEGKVLAYVFEETGTNVEEPGDVVVAFSQDIRVEDLVAKPTRWSVAASENVVLDTYTDDQDALAAAYSPELSTTFEEIWETIRFRMYPGALKGPKGVLQQGQGNDLEQAWLMIETAEKLGFEGRFVRGDPGITEDVFLNWTGFTDANTAYSVLGVRDTLEEHAWTEIQVDDGVWLELDPSFIQYDWKFGPETPGPSDTEQLDGGLERVMENTTYNSQESVTDIPVESAEQERNNSMAPVYEKWVGEDLMGANTTHEVLGGSAPRNVTEGEEPARTPQTRFDQVPGSEKWSVTITLDGKSLTQPTPALYGKTVTIGSRAETSEDQQKITDAGGLTNLSRTSVHLLTDLFVDRQESLTIGPHNPGDRVSLQVTASRPSGGTVFSHDSPVRIAGGYSVALDIGATPAPLVDKAASNQQEVVERMENGSMPMGAENRSLPFYQMQGWDYFEQTHAFKKQTGRGANVMPQPLVGAAVTGQKFVPVIDEDGTETVSVQPPHIDVQSLENRYPRDGNESHAKRYSLQTGMFASQMEGSLFGQSYGVGATSTFDVLQEAAQAGQPLHHITDRNIDDVLPSTNLPDRAKQSIRQAVADGKEVMAPNGEITKGNWTGTGWSEVDPDNGLGGWLLLGANAPTNGETLTAPQLIQGGSATGSSEMIESLGTALDAVGSAILEVVGDGTEMADKWGKRITVFKFLLQVGGDLHDIHTDPCLNAGEQMCVGAWQVLNDLALTVGSGALTTYVWGLLQPHCIAGMVAGGISLGPLGLIGALMLCILVMAVIIALISWLASQLHDLAKEGATDVCEQLIDG